MALDIAVVGVSTLFPGSSDAGGFWRDLLAGTDRITEVPETHWLAEDYYDPDPTAEDKTWCKRGGFLDPVDFPPLAFGLPPRLLPATDSSQLLALIVARQVLEDAARGDYRTVNRERCSVILGVTGGQELFGTLAGRLQRPIWRKVLREHGLPESEVEGLCQRMADQFVPWQEGSFPGLLGNVVAGRVAHRLDLGGMNCVVDAACASALGALALAIDELALGHSDLVIAGGVDTMNDPFMYMCFTRTPALSKSQECRPFSADGDGTLLGEGLGMVALKRLPDAERDGDRIYAVIRGVGSSSDGLGPGIYAPVSEGQAKALRRAYAQAGYGPETVELVEAHGTGTRAGDAAELGGLQMVFGEASGTEKPWCALGSVKSQVGHTKAAAGAAGLIKAVLALHHGVLPPTIKVHAPNQALDLAGPLYLNTAARPWVRGPDHPRRASVSAFGFGGSNYHVALEEYLGAQPALRHWGGPPALVMVQADDRPGLIAAVDALRQRAQAPGAALQTLARDSQLGWGSRPQRLAVIVGSLDQLRERLDQVHAALRSENGHGPRLPPGAWLGRGPREGTVAFLFPGQGSQRVGMGAELAMAFPDARAAWDRAEAVSQGWSGRLSRRVYPPPAWDDRTRQAQAAALTETAWAQPALAASSLALLALLRRAGVRPDALLGHSFGELVALHAADAMDADALVRLARARGEAMAGAAERGGEAGSMAAVFGPEARVSAVLDALGETAEGVVIANHNSPDQVVLAGPSAALDAATTALQAAGLQVKPLPVAAAFHSSLVSAACAPFAEALAAADLRAPRLPVIAGADAEIYPPDTRALRARLAEQIAVPVRFSDSVRQLFEDGARIYVEVGSGNVLCGLVGRVLGPAATTIALDRPGDGLGAFWEGLGRLAVAGVPVDFAPLWSHLREALVPRAEGLTVPVSGTNPGRPYPPPGGARALPPPNPERVAAPPVAVEAPVYTASDISERLEVPVSKPVAPSPLVAPSAPTYAAPSLAGSEALAWMGAWTELQRQTSATHQSFQSALQEGHLAYLRAMETSFAGLAALAGVQIPVGAAPAQVAVAAVPVVSSVAGQAPLRPFEAPAGQPALAFAPGAPPPPSRGEESVGTRSSSRLPERPVAPAHAPVVAAPAPVVAAAAPVAPAPVVKAPVAAAAGPDLRGLLLDVVADKTGYPAEMLDLSMGLASDLGIDSIKRVEILSALRAKVPSLPELDMAALASLRTLAQVLDVVQGAGGKAAPAAEAPSDRRFLLVPHPLPQTPTLVALPDGTRTLALLPDRGGVAEALAARLRARGLAVLWIADPAEPPPCDGLILLGGLDGDAATSRDAFRAARAVARRALPRLLVTVQATGGDFGQTPGDRARALRGGLVALARTAAREWPDARVRALDLATTGLDADTLAARIEAELLADGPREVGIDLNGARLTLIDQAAPRPPVADVLRPGDVVLVSGGARGVTATAVLALAEQLPLRFALLGRTALAEEGPETLGIADEAGLRRALLQAAKSAGEALSPAALAARASALRASREARATLAALQERRVEARYLPVDVQDPAALDHALSELRAAWGPVAGLVHGAGVLADATIVNKEDAAFDRVYDTKVGGFLALLDALRADPLRLVIAFSSVAARYGNAGQVDYAMANEILGQLCAAEAAARPGCRARALAWGPWDGGMVTPALREVFRSRGVPLLAPEVGAALFVDEVRGDGPGTVVLGGRLIEPEAPPAPDAREVEVWARADLQPWILDHRVQGVPVLPAVQVLAWFQQALAQGWPGLHVAALEDLAVLRGAPLPEFEAAGHRFGVRAAARPDGDGLVVDLKLVGDPSRPPLYKARARLVRDPVALPRPATPADGTPWQGDPYQSALFHGPAFQVLDRVQTAPDHASAGLHRGAGRHSEGPPVDLLDGGLQLLRLWAWVPLGGASLPTRIGRVRLAPGGAGSVACWLTGQGVSDGRATADLALVGPDGEALALLEGVEHHAVPSEVGRAL